MSTYVFPNLIPGRGGTRMPPDFQLLPDVKSGNLPVTPPIPPTVNTGDLITAAHENTVTTSLSNLWTDVQSLANSMLTDPTTLKGDMLVRGTALTKLAVGNDGQTLLADSTQPLGVKWGIVNITAAGGVPSTRRVNAGTGMTGGGPLSSDVTLNANVTSVFGRMGDVVLTPSDITAAGGVPTSRKVIAGTGLVGGGDLTADRTFTVIADSMVQQVRVSQAGALIGTRRELNFINGSNVTIGLLDDLANNRINITVNSTGGTGGSGQNQSPWLSNIDATNYILFNVGKIGVGMPSPVYAVDVTGDVNVTGNFRVNGTPLSTTAGVASFNTRTGAVLPLANDYTAAMVTNAVSSAGSYADPAWITSLAWNKITGKPAAVSYQTPWLSDIDAASYMLYNVFKIGIGLATPATKLVIGASPGMNNFFALQSSDVSFIFGTDGSTNCATIQCMAGGNNTTLGTSPYRMALQPQGGMVAIGSVSPAYELDINGDCNLGGTGRAYRINGVALSAANIAGCQTPWLSDIDGNGHALAGASGITCPKYVLPAETDYEWWTAAYTAAGYYQITHRKISDASSVNALTIDLSGNVGIGTTAPPAKFAVSNAGAGGLEINPSTTVGSATGVYLASYDRAASVYRDFYFDVGSAAAVTIKTAVGVGIGTSNPQSLLHLVTSASAAMILTRFGSGRSFTAANDGQVMGFTCSNGTLGAHDFGAIFAGSDPTMANGGSAYMELRVGGNATTGALGSTAAWVQVHGNGTSVDSLALKTNGANRLVIDSNGNCGVGTSTPHVLLEAYYNAATSVNIMAGGSTGAIGFGTYSNVGMIQGYTSTVGAGGANIVLQPNNSNVGIGVVSPATRLHVQGPGGVTSFTGSTRLGVTVEGASTSDGSYSGIDFQYNGSSIPITRIAAQLTTNGSNLVFGTSNNYSAGITNAALFIGYNGNVGVNTGALVSYPLQVNGDCNITGTYRVNGVALVTGGVTVQNNASNMGTFTTLNFGNSAQNQWSMSAAGNTLTIVWLQVSDERLKAKVRDLDGGLSVIERLRPREFEWNGLAHTAAGKRGASLVAQELQRVLPTAVETYYDRLRPEDDEDTELLHIDSTEILMQLILAVQQLSAEVRALKF
jgi:hypothetical protein